MKLSEILNNSEKCMNVMCLMVVIAFAITLAIWGACRGIVIVLDSVYGNNPPNIKALEVDDVRQYKFTDTENNVEYIITDKPDGVTTSRKNIE